jgi:hypothetical protein
VLQRRLEPVNRERLALLDECEQAAGENAAPLESVLRALIDPPMRLARDPACAAFVKLMGRILADGDAVLIRRHFGGLVERFLLALHRTLPELSADELRWRAYFGIAVLGHTLLGSKGFLGLSGEATTEQLVAFISAGFRAPVPAVRSSS